jgi:hypothetical protein
MSTIDQDAVGRRKQIQRGEDLVTDSSLLLSKGDFHVLFIEILLSLFKQFLLLSLASMKRAIHFTEQ